LPLNNDSVIPPKEGTMVFGFFMDGQQGQNPIIMGQLPGIPDTTTDPSHGFSDPRNTSQLQSSPRPPQSVQYSANGSGVTITEAPNANRNPQNLNEPTTSRIARNENISSTIIQQKINNTVKNIPIGTGSNTNPPPTFSEPTTPYNAIYPYDKVIETEGGHVIEIDDTPGAGRIHIFHRSGTFIEIGPNGQTVEKVTGNRFDITLADKYENVMGINNKTINGNENNLIQGNLNENINGNKNISIDKSETKFIEENLIETVNGKYNLTISGSYNILVQGICDIQINAPMTISYPNLTLNGDITLNGSLTATGDIIAGGISLENHTHSGVQRGSYSTNTPQG